MPTPLNLNWVNQGINGTDVSAGFTQNTGGINVGVSYSDDGLGNQFDISTDPQFTGGGPFASNSAVELRGDAGVGDTSTTTISFDSVAGSGFSNDVENVQFRINDADVLSWTDLVRVRAFDANGDPIDVTLTYQGATQTGTTPLVTGTGGNVTSATESGSILVEIAGPVAYFEIDYGNDGTGAQALWVTDIHFDAIDLDGTVEGSAGNDVIDDTYILDPDGDRVDNGDEILPGYGTDGDLIEAYGGNDTILAGAGDDSIYAGTGADSVSGGTGDDTVFLEGGNDTFGASSTEDGNDTVFGGGGRDTIDGGADNDELYGGNSDDVLIGGAGDDSLYGGTGTDRIEIADNDGSDLIEGGENGNGLDIDIVAFSNATTTDGVTVTATGDEAGTYDFDGTSSDGTYSEIEGFEGTQSDDTFNLGADNSGTSVAAGTGDDIIITGSGDDVIDGGQGADTFNTGGGNDQINLGEDSPGTPDQDPDVIILQDGFGDDIVTNFDAPVVELDGTLTGIDMLEVSTLTDGTYPVNTDDVTVTDDGSGNAVLEFPNGETITLIGISPTDADNPFYLNAIGIPMPDGTVEGTAGDDVIDGTYAGDPHGDFVDDNDAILPGDTGDDDLIFGYGGNDNITAGAGDDEVYGGTGDDTFNISQASGTDDIEGGEDLGDGAADIDTLDFTDTNGPEGVDVVMTGNESGTYSYATDGGDGSFIEIEQIDLTDQNDSVDATSTTTGITISGQGGDDTVEGGSGNDVIAGDITNPTATPAAIDAGQLFLDVSNVAPGSETGTPGDAQVGDSVVFNNAGTLPDGTIISVRVTVASVTDPDVTIDLTESQAGAPLRVSGNGDASNAGEAVDFQLEFFDQATGLPIVIGGQATVTDIDNNAGAGEEYVSFSDTDVNSYTVSDPTDISSSVSGGTVTGTGTTTNNASDQDAWFGVDFNPTSSLVMTVGVVEDTANYGFSGSDITGGVTTPVNSGGNDSLSGGAGDDYITGDGGDDIIDGGADDDTLFGGSGQDTLTGGTGADTIVGGADQDVIYGGGGDVIDGSEDGTDFDTLIVTGAVSINYDVGNPENGTVDFADGTSLTFTNIENVINTNDGTVSGTAGNDLIDDSYTGDPNGDLVDANDAILPGDTGDDDLIEAGAGNDTILAGDGNDEIYAGTGNDTVTAGDGADTVFGEAGNDIINGGTGADTLFGGDGADEFVLDTGFGSDVIEGGEGGVDQDQISTTMSDDVTVTTSGDEAGTISDGTSTATFEEIESISTQGGDDTIDLSGDSAGMTVTTNAGSDTITGGSGDDVISAGTGDDTVIANAGNNTIDAGAGDDSVTLGSGNDNVGGGTGDDTFIIDDTSGTNTIVGGEGDENAGGDVLSVVSDTDVTVTTSGDEAGSLTTGGTTVDFSEIEAIETAGGNDSVDLGGDTSGMEVSMGAGDDTFTGGTGDDSVQGGNDRDTFIFNDNFGDDTIIGGQGGDNFDTLDLSGLSNSVTVVFTGPGAGTVTDDVTGDVITFSEIEFLITTNQADTVDATLDNGNTLVNTLEGTDTYTGSAGNDVVDDESGPSDGAGNDTFFGGAGNDDISAGDDDDTLFGGAGEDTLFGQDGDDTLVGGTGDDGLEGGLGSDTFVIEEDDGSDIILGEENVGDNDVIDFEDTASGGGVTVTFVGDEAGTYDFDNATGDGQFIEIETIDATDEDDTVNAGADTGGVTIIGNDGDDSIAGGSGADDIFGGADDDTITGGAGADSIDAGTGDDTVTFAEGDDVSGGSGDDLFVLEDLGELTNGTITIDGGAGDETPDPDGAGPLTGGDTLQLGGLATLTDAVRDTFVDDGTGSFSGSVTLDDGTILNFSEIENIICFTPGTRIATPKGLIAIEDLEVGDMVVTRDHGLQPIRWIEGRTVPAIDRFAPVRIGKNVLAGQERDLIVSPQHRVLFHGYRAELLFGESEVLVSAKHLVDGQDVTQDEGEMVTYVHILFDQHEVIFAEGAPTESFHPGDIGFSAVADQAREELFAIFPELRADPSQYGNTARRCLKAHEAQLIRL